MNLNVYKQWLPYALLLIAALPLLFMNVHELHSWGGDDYALYIREADNISKGLPFYATNYVFYSRNLTYSPPQYPPGFPLLLAPVVKLFGLAIKPMLLWLTAMIAAFMTAMFAWLRKEGAGVPSAFCIALLAGYSWMVVDTKDQVLSDIPCMLFTMLYLLVRASGKTDYKKILLLISVAVMAMLIRTQSILLLGAEVLYLVFTTAQQLCTTRKININTLLAPAAIIGGSYLLHLLLNKTVFYVPTTAGAFYNNYLRTALQEGIFNRFRYNFGFVTEVVSHCFCYPTTRGFNTLLITFLSTAGLTLTATGFIICLIRRPHVKDFFFVLVIIMLLYYPIHDKRYFLPALPLVFYYSYSALKTIINYIPLLNTIVLSVVTTVIVLASGLDYFRTTFKQPVGYVPAANDRKAFDYLQKHVNDNELILFSRPRFLTLYTNKRCMVQAWLLPMKENKQIFDSMQVKYALTVRGLADDFNNYYLHHVQQPLDSVVIADGYTLYRLR